MIMQLAGKLFEGKFVWKRARYIVVGKVSVVKSAD